MIAFLRGTLASKHPPQLTVEVAGVGYEVEAPMSTFYSLPEPGHALTLLTHEVVREDAHTLYGFATDAERDLFRRLLKVSGVGARMALSILSGITVEGFRQCVVNEDIATLVKLPGIGRKTAQRLVIEMADRLPVERPSTLPGVSADTESEAYGALIALGYKPGEVTRMLKTVDCQALATEEIIRQALRQVHGSNSA